MTMRNKATGISCLHLVFMLCIAAQAGAVELTAPVMLVATEQFAGSTYERTVVLAVPSGDGRHVGLIVNRPTSVCLSAAFPEYASSQKAGETVFFGGPTLAGNLFAAIRVASPPSNYSVTLMPGLYLVTDRDTVDRLVYGLQSSARYFAGFVMWDFHELAAEVEDGLWRVAPADAAMLFLSDPQELWFELARKEKEIAAY